MLIAFAGAQAVGTMVGIAVSPASGVRLESANIGISSGRALGVMLGVSVLDGTDVGVDPSACVRVAVGEGRGVQVGKPVRTGVGVGVRDGRGEGMAVDGRVATEMGPAAIAVGEGHGTIGFK